MHTCPRCESKADLMAKSPVEGAWEVYMCPVCIFTWRSIEPESITKPEKYNRAFKVDPADIPLAENVPPLPAKYVNK
ncbi:non-oxidative hydroxyarylic acid decarboxylases subunit D [Peribacillus kribbensis]|uniref:non-oxidative hydroxyarylic acid decarboxylases subunit D n=1 Tax=Peribacillus kribbensis TaxID=356658 RepID=UPI00047D8C7B|nr:non-oxidative hydroxyarylic acid decarboxylases subunit D [Peribacillus kribbensis]